MRIINVIVFLVLGGGFGILQILAKREHGRWNRCQRFVKSHWHLLVLIIVANSISFAMTFVSGNKNLLVERDEYGGKEKEVSVLFTKGEEQEKWQLPVHAKKLTDEQLKQRVEDAFLYLETHLQGKNPSLKEVRSALDYSLDYEEFPFDVEFVVDRYTLIDEEGTIKNKEEELISQGYSEKDLKSGIPVVLEVTLWYEDQSYSRKYDITVFPIEKSDVEEAFTLAKKELEREEETAAYEDGFYIPAKVGEVEISLSEDGISPAQVLMAGFILVALLLLREQENTKNQMQQRKDKLIRSYPWFVNELLLLMGAGMQTRNILAMMIQEYEDVKETSDYRNPLMKEIKVAVQAMTLGMSEEQAYYKLGRRLGLSCYIKIMTMLEQNVKRGGKGLGEIFEQEELQALEERKNLAKRLGEEAGTKLLGPMIILLLTIMLMIMLPAFWGFA